jgi:hypothetical protein
MLEQEKGEDDAIREDLIVFTPLGFVRAPAGHLDLYHCRRRVGVRLQFS